MASNPVPAIGTILTNENDEQSMVVELHTTLLDGLLELIAEAYGGDHFAPDNPAIVDALAHATIGTWRTCSKQWCEANEVDDEDFNTYWAPDGDGEHTITVVAYPGSVYVLGEMAEVCMLYPCIHGPGNPYKCGHPDCVGARV